MSEDEYYEDDDDVEYYAVRPNKTQIKKDIAVLFKMGEDLSKLPLTKLESFQLPENIHKAIIDVAGMPLNGARKRLLKYIASQFHKIDVGEIQEKLAKLQNQSAHAVREHHQTEHWRDRLIAEGNSALTELYETYPAIDLQHIRNVLRSVKKESQTGQPAKSTRLLYRYLKTIFDEDGF